MAQIIEVNGEEFEFPDDMSDSDIKSALQSNGIIQPLASNEVILGDTNLQQQPITAPPLAQENNQFNVSEAQQAFGISPSRAVRATSVVKGLFEDPVNAVLQFTSKDERERIDRLESSFQKQREKAGVSGFDFMRLAGNVASPLTLGGAALGARALSSSNKLKTMFNPKVIEGAGGAIGGGAFLPVQSETAETDQFIIDKLAQTGWSAVLGGGLAKVIGGLTPTLKEGAKEQIAAGVQVSPGQAYEGLPGWVFRQIDNVLTYGDALTSKVKLSFTKSAADDVLSTIGVKTPTDLKDGQQVVNFARQQISKSYDDALSDINIVNLDNTYINGVKATMARAKEELSPKDFNQFKNIVQGNLKSKLKLMDESLEIDGPQLKMLDRFFKENANKVKNSTDSRGISLYNLYNDLAMNNSAFISRVDPTGRVAAANEAYKKLYRVAAASESAATKGGSFSPEQLMRASTTQATSTLEGGGGQAPMQEFAKKGINILGHDSAEDGLRATYRSLAVGSRIASGSALYWASPSIAIPMFVASGLSYGAAKALLKNPSKARVFMEKALQKVSPRVVNSIITRATQDENNLKIEE
jgi:hypothetical protein